MKKTTSMRTTLLKIIIPFVLSLIVVISIFSAQLNSTLNNDEVLYYDHLYTINSSLINADRDMHQAFVAATQYYDISSGYSSISPELKDSTLVTKAADYAENTQQALDNVRSAISIAKADNDLYSNTTLEETSFAQYEEAFEREFAAWLELYDLESMSGDWNAFQYQFKTARADLSNMQDIVEEWAKAEKAKNEKTVHGYIIASAVAATIVTVILFIIGMKVSSRITKMLNMMCETMERMAGGDLKTEITAKATITEFAKIVSVTDGMRQRLFDIINKTKGMATDLNKSGIELSDSAEQASGASEQVAEAVDEISRGAVAQAESVETAADNVQNIGFDIETIAENVDNLDKYSKDMKKACDSAMGTLSNLIRQSGDVQISVKEIGDTIDSTNESAKAISEFSNAITDIASQTNLLSLNASIEAARAGEAGKGFAVVAQEIGSLATQSSQSADEIKKIVDKLLEDAAASVDVMHRLNDSFIKQSDQMDATKVTMQSMAGNVDHVSGSADVISEKVEKLKDAKDKLVEIISDLSAISEENAASAQETNASMEELNATFSVISEAASKLQVVATDMTETISYFN